jgi:hypothetical protein
MIKNNSERIAAREARKQDRFARKEDKLAFKDEKKNVRAIGKAAGMNGISRLGMRMATKAADNMVKVEGNPEGIVGKAVNFANKVLPQAGQALVKAVSEGGGTLNELYSAGKDALKLTDIEKKDSEILTNTVIKADEDLDETMKWAGDQSEYGSPGNIEARANAQIEEKNITDGVVAEGEVNIPEAEKIAETPLPGSGGTASNVMNAGGNKTTFDAGMTVYDAKKDIARLALNGPDEISNLALENLNVQDYYPNVNKDIAVGTYSGKYLGTSTIYAAPGAIIPLGLYNERKKALAKAAIEKQAAVDRLLAAPETSAQYQVQYNEAFFKGLEPFLTNVKDLNSLSANPEFLKYMANMKGKAREITQSVTFAKDMVDAAANDKNYVPKAMQQTARDVLHNQINNLDAILAGDVNANAPFKDAQVYINMRPQVDALAKDLLNPDRMGQSPINLKTGGEFDTEAWNKDRSAFFNRVRSGIGYEEYASGIVKFFTGDHIALIDNLIASQPGATAEQAEALQKYFAAQIQPQTILKYDTVNTDEVAMANLAFQRKKWETEREDANFWGQIHNFSTTDINPKTKKSFNQEVSELNKKNYTAAQKAAKFEEISMAYGVGPVYKDPATGSWVNYVAANASQVAKDATPADINTLTYFMKYKDDKGIEVERNVTMNEAAYISRTRDFTVNGKTYKKGKEDTKTFASNVQSAKTNGIYTKEIGTQIQRGYYDGDKFFALTSENSAKYEASNRKANLAIPILQPYTRTTTFVPGDKGTAVEATYEDKSVGGTVFGPAVDISEKGGQQVYNNMTGMSVEKAAGTTN